MLKKSTAELLAELSGTDDFSRFMTRNHEEMVNGGIGSMIDSIRREKNLTKAELTRRAGISEYYMYQILKGRRKPSRDTILALCLGLGCTLEQTEDILKTGCYASLYVRVPRDAAIIYGIQQEWDVARMNDMLFDLGEAPLGEL